MATVIEQPAVPRVSNNQIFAQDGEFWGNYNKGRPVVPSSFFERIHRYHQEKAGRFGTAHDAGAGNGIHSKALRSEFQHVIVSDVVAENIRQAEERLGTDGYSYHTCKIEDTGNIAPGSVDLVVILNALHWADQRRAMQAVASQLKVGGTFACAGFGPARFRDEQIQDVWERISQEGGRVLLRAAENGESTLGVMARSEDFYNVAPLDPACFQTGARRIHLNMESGGLVGLIPPELRAKVTEPDHRGAGDVITFEKDEDWRFEFDIEGFKQHFRTFPHAFMESSAFAPLLQEVERLVSRGCRLDGHWPVTLILATRS